MNFSNAFTYGFNSLFCCCRILSHEEKSDQFYEDKVQRDALLKKAKIVTEDINKYDGQIDSNGKKIQNTVKELIISKKKNHNDPHFVQLVNKIDGSWKETLNQNENDAESEIFNLLGTNTGNCSKGTSKKTQSLNDN